MIFLLHGAYYGPEIWGEFPKLLSRRVGQPVEAVDLRPTIGSFEERVQRLGDAVRKSEGQGAIIVAHSLGGIFAAEVLARWPNLIDKVVYVAAYLPQSGQSVADLARLDNESIVPTVRSSTSKQGFVTIDAKGAAYILFHDLPQDLANKLASQAQPQPTADFKQVSRQGPSTPIASSYVVCTKDRAIGPTLQRKMAQTANCDPILQIDAGHMPMVAAPEKLTKTISQIL
ncbi:alpha/beta hydrolase [Limibacillus sp. MBR-115]|jgi:pimeloyl-ACP methyl ester carboxylesterase|uniref:alpha/beta fold hydrolase n=1 Tax=Limibacillus sp. MBR-115 TaxID=3156465 RepID=UPI00339708B1